MSLELGHQVCRLPFDLVRFQNQKWSCQMALSFQESAVIDLRENALSLSRYPRASNFPHPIHFFTLSDYFSFCPFMPKLFCLWKDMRFGHYPSLDFRQ